jgi:hypothetical protein
MGTTKKRMTTRCSLSAGLKVAQASSSQPVQVSSARMDDTWNKEASYELAFDVTWVESSFKSSSV